MAKETAKLKASQPSKGTTPAGTSPPRKHKRLSLKVRPERVQRSRRAGKRRNRVATPDAHPSGLDWLGKVSKTRQSLERIHEMFQMYQQTRNEPKLEALMDMLGCIFECLEAGGNVHTFMEDPTWVAANSTQDREEVTAHPGLEFASSATLAASSSDDEGDV